MEYVRDILEEFYFWSYIRARFHLSVDGSVLREVDINK